MAPMLPQLPGLGIRFDIGKIESAGYGLECWKVIWRAVEPEKVGITHWFEGDSAATLEGRENVYCIAVQSWERPTRCEASTARSSRRTTRG